MKRRKYVQIIIYAHEKNIIPVVSVKRKLNGMCVQSHVITRNINNFIPL